MKEREIYMKLFDISINTYYNWKKENRIIMKLLEKYFTNEELEEFLLTKKIEKFEKELDNKDTLNNNLKEMRAIADNFIESLNSKTKEIEESHKEKMERILNSDTDDLLKEWQKRKKIEVKNDKNDLFYKKIEEHLK